MKKQKKDNFTEQSKPVACITPFPANCEKPIPGTLADTHVFEKDIVSPLGEKSWESAK